MVNKSLQNRRTTIALALAAIVIAYLLGIIRPPKALQVSYYTAVFKLTKPEQNTEGLKSLHQATKVVDPETGKLTTRYSKRDKPVTQNDSAKCMACHGNMRDREDDGSPKHYIHEKMLSQTMLDFNCTDCHKDVDFRKRSPGHVTIRVDRRLCPICHNPSGTIKTAEQSGGASWGAGGPAPPPMPNILPKHGWNKKNSRQWITNHPRIAMKVGIGMCRKCHIRGSELDFCRACHLRGGFRPSNHAVQYNAPINSIYAESPRTEIVPAKWKGYHMVFVREALSKMGTTVDNPRTLPLEKIEKLPCGACHVLQDWCTRCHIKHNPNWLTSEGHPKMIKQYGNRYCFRCHDSLGTKCFACHDKEFVEKLL